MTEESGHYGNAPYIDDKEGEEFIIVLKDVPGGKDGDYEMFINFERRPPESLQMGVNEDVSAAEFIAHMLLRMHEDMTRMAGGQFEPIDTIDTMIPEGNA